MNRAKGFLLIVTISFTGFVACQSKYERTLKAELASGERYDSLFLGFKFGMSRDDFYNRGWELNRQQMVKEGPGNSSIQYPLKELKSPGKMIFYPRFIDDKLYRMPVSFSYDGWAPWNKALSSDSLLVDVLGMFKKWYGNDFFEVKGEDGVAYVKIDGNRRISIFRESEIAVGALFSDMTIKDNPSSSD